MNLIQLKEQLGNCGKVADNVKHDDAYEEISMMITTGGKTCQAEDPEVEYRINFLILPT